MLGLWECWKMSILSNTGYLAPLLFVCLFICFCGCSYHPQRSALLLFCITIVLNFWPLCLVLWHQSGSHTFSPLLLVHMGFVLLLFILCMISRACAFSALTSVLLSQISMIALLWTCNSVSTQNLPLSTFPTVNTSNLLFLMLLETKAFPSSIWHIELCCICSLCFPVSVIPVLLTESSTTSIFGKEFLPHDVVDDG